jgi:hypothetical protein
MARAPRAKVSVSSGQGVSRKAYQTAYRLGGDARVKGEFSAGSAGGERPYAKKKSKADYPKGINISYGDTYEPTDLADVKAIAERKPPKGWKTGGRKTKMKGLK